MTKSSFEIRQEARLAQQYAGYIEKLAAWVRHHYKLPFYVGEDDLCQVGYLGLIQGLRCCSWDKPSRSIDYYLKKRIRAAMLDEVRTMLPASRFQGKVFINSWEELIDLRGEPVESYQIEELIEAVGLLNLLQGRKQEIILRHYFLDEELHRIPVFNRDGRQLTESRISQLRTEALEELRGQVLEKQNREMWGRIEGLEMITNSKNGRSLPIKVEK